MIKKNSKAINEVLRKCIARNSASSSDVDYVKEIIGFADKFRVLHWAAQKMNLHKTLDEFCDEIEGYKDAIAENIQSIIGQFVIDDFLDIKMPICADAKDLINQLKQSVNKWMELHEDDEEYEGCRNATSEFLETIHKYVYLLRLCK